MSQRRSTESLEIEGLLPALDDQPGPAQPLSAVAQAALIEQALKKGASASVPSTRRGIVFGGAAAITGIVTYALFRRWSPTPDATPVHFVANQKTDSTRPLRDSQAAGTQAAKADLQTEERAAVASDPLSPRSPAAKKSDPRSAQDLLRMANDRRRKKRFAEALQIYQQIVQQDPSSEEGYVARVAAGGLLLEKKKQPQAALRMFRSALRARPYGSLTEEARLGVCDALALLSDRGAEAQAVREFLAHHGDSPARARMEARLRHATERTSR